MKYCVHFIFKDNKVLLLRRTLSNPFYPGIWTPVVGKIKPNEKPNLAVKRETKEETSIELDNSQFLKHCTFDNDESNSNNPFEDDVDDVNTEDNKQEAESVNEITIDDINFDDI